MKKIEITINEKMEEIYDYLKKRATELNEEIGAELITPEDIAAGILMRAKERDDKHENRIEKHQSAD